MRTITMFEEKHMLAIIRFLYLYGKSSKTELYDGVSRNPRMPDKLRILEYEGLLTMYIDESIHNTTFIQLTDKGEKIAEHIMQIDDILTDE